MASVYKRKRDRQAERGRVGTSPTTVSMSKDAGAGGSKGFPDFSETSVLAIPYAAMSETSSNCWKLSVISVFSCSAWVVERPSRISWMAAWNSANVGW